MNKWIIQPTTGSDGAYERGQIWRAGRKIDRLVACQRQRGELAAKLLTGRRLP